MTKAAFSLFSIIAINSLQTWAYSIKHIQIRIKAAMLRLYYFTIRHMRCNSMILVTSNKVAILYLSICRTDIKKKPFYSSYELR